jgi:hypothetical protein
MKSQSIRLLPILFVMISMLNTAFVIQEKSIATPINTSVQPSEGTPQYKTSKMSFFEKIRLYRSLKRIEKGSPNTDKTVKQMKNYAILSWGLMAGGLLFLIFSVFASSLNVVSALLVIGAILLLMSPIFTFLSIARANSILEQPEVAGVQAQQAKRIRGSGYCGLITYAALIATILWIFQKINNG